MEMCLSTTRVLKRCLWFLRTPLFAFLEHFEEPFTTAAQNRPPKVTFRPGYVGSSLFWGLQPPKSDLPLSSHAPQSQVPMKIGPGGS